jgi:ATP-dependent helicase/nuclease subunit B
MLSVKTGLYHPFLEDSFVATIRALKKDDPLVPLAVVTPTNVMMNHLQKRLAHEQGTSFINISFVNFFILASEICRYSGFDVGRLVTQPVLYECLIEGLLKDPSFRGSLGKNVRSLRALSRALFRVTQDLTDANVCPDDLKQAIKEKFIEGTDIQKLYGIAHLYDTLRQKLTALKISNYSDVYRLAIPSLSDSQFLTNFRYILAYGFYDLTGVELDFFREIFKFHPTILFLPYQKKHMAFSYVKPFFESFILGLAHDVEEISSSDDTSSFPCGIEIHGNSGGIKTPQKNDVYSGNCSIINTSGKKDEIWTVAKEILTLADEGYKMEEIGIVARIPGPYKEDMKRIFRENCIPLVTDLQESLERYPLVKVVRQILLLHRENYYRSMVIELLRSPYFKMPVPESQGFIPRPDLWDILSRRLGIRGGIECWLSRLERAEFVSTEGENEFAGSVDEEGAGRRVHIPPEQILFLKHILHAISNDVSSLPEKASWSVMGQKIAGFLKNHICTPSGGMNPEDEERDHMIMHKIGELLGILQTLDCLNEEVTRDQFIDTFLEACRQEGLPMGLQNSRGVTVLDAASAWGIPFRVLFVLGLNEKVFPRAISEEPFLRDHVRRKLTEVLGNYIPERLRGFDEERLLFYLIVNSARERLYLLYERSDEAGKPKIPSHYLIESIQNRKGLSEVTKDTRKRAEGVISVPRGMKDKLCKRGISLLTPKEIGIRLALERASPILFLKAFGANPDTFVRSQLALNLIDSYHPYLTAYDGIVDTISPWWNEQKIHGFSPTALEVFGVCPFKFFVEKVLKLESLDEPEKDTITTAADLGDLYHNILRDFYHTLLLQGHFHTKTDTVNPVGLLHHIAQKYFRDREHRTPIPYPIVWELEKEGILASLTNFIVWDLKQIDHTGYIPAFLERIVKINPGDNLFENVQKILFKGKIDRIDIKLLENGVGFRVVDYKSGRFSKENIMRLAVRGQKLQLPFYIIMAEYLVSKEIGQGCVPGCRIELGTASFTYVTQTIEDKNGQKSTPEKVITAGDWKEYGEQCRDAVRGFLQYISKGIFPISPVEDSQKCEWCGFVTICRRGNQPLRFRLEHDARLKKYYEISNRSINRKSKE